MFEKVKIIFKSQHLATISICTSDAPSTWLIVPSSTWLLVPSLRVVNCSSKVLIQVGDILPRATEQRLVQPDLIDVVAYESGRPSEDEDGVKNAAPNVAVSFVPGKFST